MPRSRYQTHCRTCCRVFDCPTLDDALRAVAAHEAEVRCAMPVYDGDAFHAVEMTREVDGRYLASMPEHPGVMAYGATEDAARKACIAVWREVRHA